MNRALCRTGRELFFFVDVRVQLVLIVEGVFRQSLMRCTPEREAWRKRDRCCAYGTRASFCALVFTLFVWPIPHLT